MPGEKVLYEADERGVATLTLNDPDTRNALSAELLVELTAALQRARDESAVRCVVLASSHEKVFSSGANLGGFSADVPLVAKHEGSERFVELFKLLGEINVGAFPFMIMALIYRNVPRKKANELILLGERWSAQEALAAGIVNKVVAADAFEAAVDEWADKLAKSSPVIMRLGKDAMRRQLDMSLDDALDYLRAQLSLALSTQDIVEGVSAFFEKREPQWSGR